MFIITTVYRSAPLIGDNLTTFLSVDSFCPRAEHEVPVIAEVAGLRGTGECVNDLKWYCSGAATHYYIVRRKPNGRDVEDFACNQCPALHRL